MKRTSWAASVTPTDSSTDWQTCWRLCAIRSNADGWFTSASTTRRPFTWMTAVRPARMKDSRSTACSKSAEKKLWPFTLMRSLMRPVMNSSPSRWKPRSPVA